MATCGEYEYQQAMDYLYEVKQYVDNNVQDSREKSIAKTKLEEFEMWLNKAENKR